MKITKSIKDIYELMLLEKVYDVWQQYHIDGGVEIVIQIIDKYGARVEAVIQLEPKCV